ncbi:hypothetical protein [Novosphingobium rosa]|uniref:hypothetical protein n=1 Tax=Novosphingobium rosa TaxID=76978 RepID=UPI0012ECFB8F|nr:hypothetical protein [Novosphingobium rosa]
MRLAILAGGLREDRHLPGLKPLAGSVCRTADRAVPKAALRGLALHRSGDLMLKNVDEAFDQSQSRNGFAPGQRDCVRSMVRDTGRKQPCDFMSSGQRVEYLGSHKVCISYRPKLASLLRNANGPASPGPFFPALQERSAPSPINLNRDHLDR